MNVRLRLLGRPDCGLCDEMALELILAFAADPVELVVEDVDSNPEWTRRYGLRVPVVLDEWNEVVFEGRFDPDAFEQFQAQLRRG